MALRIHCIHRCNMWHTIPWWSLSAQSSTRNKNPAIHSTPRQEM